MDGQQIAKQAARLASNDEADLALVADALHNGSLDPGPSMHSHLGGDTASAPFEPQPLSPDWVNLVKYSEHVARDRRWFNDDDYIPYKSLAVSGMFRFGTIVGIGSVDLPTKRLPTAKKKRDSNKRGNAVHRTLHLKNVLHIPDSPYNVIGKGLLNDYRVVKPTDDEKKNTQMTEYIVPLGERADIANAVAYFFQEDSIFGNTSMVKLSGPPVGPPVGSSFFVKRRIVLPAIWPEEEQEKFMAYRRNVLGLPGKGQGPQAEQKAPPEKGKEVEDEEWWAEPEKKKKKRKNRGKKGRGEKTSRCATVDAEGASSKDATLVSVEDVPAEDAS